MSTTVIIVASIVLNVALLLFVMAPKIKPWLSKVKNKKSLKKAREVKLIRDEVRRYLDELREQ